MAKIVKIAPETKITVEMDEIRIPVVKEKVAINLFTPATDPNNKQRAEMRQLAEDLAGYLYANSHYEYFYALKKYMEELAPNS